MVSIRRRKLKGPCNGFAGRSSFLVPLRSIRDGNAPQNPEQNVRSASMLHVPSTALNQPVEVKEEKEIITSPPAKKRRLHAEIDPKNPIEVHAYLMKLKEDNRLELGPLQRNEEISVKEWMEKCYPHIFRVFPQNPKVFSQFSDKSKQNDLLHCHYWLFLFGVRNIVLMDYNVSPDYVESLGKVIKTLEMQGFDCRFMRSEMVVVMNMMKKHQEIMLAERNLIAKRSVNLEKELAELSRKKEKESEVEKREVDIEMAVNKLQEKHGQGEPNIQEEYMEVILKRYQRMLACKEEESKRLDQVMEKINQLHRI